MYLAGKQYTSVGGPILIKYNKRWWRNFLQEINVVWRSKSMEILRYQLLITSEYFQFKLFVYLWRRGEIDMNSPGGRVTDGEQNPRSIFPSPQFCGNTPRKICPIDPFYPKREALWNRFFHFASVVNERYWSLSKLIQLLSRSYPFWKEMISFVYESWCIKSVDMLEWF